MRKVEKVDSNKTLSQVRQLQRVTSFWPCLVIVVLIVVAIIYRTGFMTEKVKDWTVMIICFLAPIIGGPSLIRSSWLTFKGSSAAAKSQDQALTLHDKKEITDKSDNSL